MLFNDGQKTPPNVEVLPFHACSIPSKVEISQCIGTGTYIFCKYSQISNFCENVHGKGTQLKNISMKLQQKSKCIRVYFMQCMYSMVGYWYRYLFREKKGFENPTLYSLDQCAWRYYK
jgi:hypothetical protein